MTRKIKGLITRLKFTWIFFREYPKISDKEYIGIDEAVMLLYDLMKEDPARKQEYMSIQNYLFCYVNDYASDIFYDLYQLRG